MEEHGELVHGLGVVDLAVGWVAAGGAVPPRVIDAVAVAFEVEPVLGLVTGPAGPWGITGDDAKGAALHDVVRHAAASGEAGAGAAVALARSCEHQGDLAAMAEHLRRAVRLDPTHALARADLAALEAVRGRSGAPLPARLGEWLARPAGQRRRLPLALRAAGVEQPLDDLDRVARALQEQALTDLYLFEAGGIEQVVAELGPLLRPDERVAIGRWVGRRHDLYRVAWRCGDIGELVSVTRGTVHDVFGLDDERLEPATAWLVGVLVPAGEDGAGDDELVAAMTAVAGHDADLFTSLLERQASPGEWAQLLAPQEGRVPG